MLKHRFNYVQSLMGEKVFVTSEVTDDKGHWVYFDLTLNGAFDALDFFHSGIRVGLDEFSKVKLGRGYRDWETELEINQPNFSDNEKLEEKSTTILDFTEKNPFGEFNREN